MSSPNAQSSLSQAAGIATGVGGIGGFISDVVYPLMPLSSILAGLFLVALIVCLLAGFFPVFRSGVASVFHWFPFSSQIRSYWQAPLVVFLVIMVVSFSFASYFSKATEEEGGFSVAVFPFIKDIQTSLGVIVKQGELIRSDTEEIKNKMHSLKKEVSDSPRKEIASYGLEWSEISFLHNIWDVDVSKAYISGGMTVKGHLFDDYVFLDLYKINENAEKLIVKGKVFDNIYCDYDSHISYIYEDKAKLILDKKFKDSDIRIRLIKFACLSELPKIKAYYASESERIKKKEEDELVKKNRCKTRQGNTFDIECYQYTHPLSRSSSGMYADNDEGRMNFLMSLISILEKSD